MQVAEGTGSATATVSVTPPATKSDSLDLHSNSAAPVPHPTTTVKAWVRSADGSLIFPERDDPKFEVPELNDKAQLAVCISGGGFRATTLALGWLRALHHMGLLDKVRYLSTISGSSWVGSALCFQKDAAAVKDFLGTYLPPDQCTPKALNDNVGAKGKSYAKAVADASPLWKILHNTVSKFDEFAADLFLAFHGIKPPQDEVAGKWTCAIAEAFLEPFGLHEVNKSTVRVPGTKVADEIEERAAKVGRADKIYDANVKDLPFLIIGQAILLPSTDAKFYPFEWTPLYGGCPAPYKDITPKLGAGWVETVGLNAELVAKQVDGVTGEVKAEVRPIGPASLGEATGISSAYHSIQWLKLNPDNIDLFRKPLGFHMAKYFDMQDWGSSDVMFTDGGGYDLYGIYPALRRQVPNIMVFNCNGKPFKTKEDFSSDKDLPGLFGCLEDEQSNKWRQVFDSAGFDKLFNALQEKTNAGQAPIHVEEYEVLTNDYLGIKGSWKVRVMWVMNERMKLWEDQLPEATRAQLRPSNKRRARALATDQLEDAMLEGSQLEDDMLEDTVDAMLEGAGETQLMDAQPEAGAPPLQQPLTTEGELPEGPQAAPRFFGNIVNAMVPGTLVDFPHVDTMKLQYTPDLVSLMANHAAWMLVSNETLVRDMFGLQPKA